MAVHATCRRDHNTAVGKIREDLKQHPQRFQTKDLHDKEQFMTLQFKPKASPIDDSKIDVVTKFKDMIEV